MAFAQVVDYGSTDGATLGKDTSAKVAFHGVNPTAQRAGAAQAALTLTTISSGGFGFTSSAGLVALIAQIEELRAALVEKGLLKGSS